MPLLYAAVVTTCGRLFIAKRGGHAHLVRHAIRARCHVEIADGENAGGFGYVTRTNKFVDAETAHAKYGIAMSEDLPTYCGRINLADAEIVEVVK